MSNDWPGSGGASTAPQERNIDMGSVLWGRVWLLLFFGAVGGGLGYLQFSKLVPVYSSSAKVRIRYNTQKLMIESTQNISYKADLDSEAELIRSPVVLRGAVERLRDNVPASLNAADLPMQIAGGLGVNKMPESDDILYLNWTGTDPHDSQRVLEAVIAAYVDYLKTSQELAAQGALKLIQHAKDELMADFSRKEAGYEKFQEDSPLSWEGQAPLNFHQSRLKDIEQLRSKATIEKKLLSTRLQTIKDARDSGVTYEALMQLLNQQLPNQAAFFQANPTKAKAQKMFSSRSAEIEAQFDQPLAVEEELERAQDEEGFLKSELGRDNPKVLAIQRRIANLERRVEDSKQRRSEQKERLLTKIKALEAKMMEADETEEKPNSQVVPQLDKVAITIESMEEELLIKDAEIEQLTETFKYEEVESRLLTSAINQNRRLLGEIDQTKRLFDTVESQLKGTELIKDNGAMSAEVISPAGKGYPLPLTIAKYVGVGAFLGMFLGAMLSYLLELSDQSFRKPEEIAQQLRAPVIGHIPVLDMGRASKKVRDTKLHQTLATYHRPGSREAESYRSVRAALFFGARTQGHRVLQVTSPNPGDGKSTLTANLAIAIAGSGKRCLLVDADFRRPKVHRLFGLENPAGVSSIIEQGLEVPDAIQTCSIPNLFLLPAGPMSKHPAELIMSSKFVELLLLLREQFDFVIIDSPPILAVSDPSALAAHVDGVVLVVQITKRARPQALRTRETLDLIGANLIGVVVNGVGSDPSGYGYGSGGYGYGYGYGYHYGYGGKEGETSPLAKMEKDRGSYYTDAPMTEDPESSRTPQG